MNSYHTDNRNNGYNRNNDDRSYSENGNDNISVTPYHRSYPRDDEFNNTKNYTNKFTDEEVYEYGNDPINVSNEKMTELKRRVRAIEQKPINISTQTYINYINVDSKQRNLNPEYNLGDANYLNCYPITFENGSKIVTIHAPDHILRPTDRITLGGVISKNLMLQNIISIKKNSEYMRINHKSHGLTLFGIFDPTDTGQFQTISYVADLTSGFLPGDDIPDGPPQYYILKSNSVIDLSINLSNVSGNSKNRSRIGNIPVNYLNNKHTVYLLFTKVGTVFISDPDAYLILLPKKSSINYKDNISLILDQNDNPTTILSTNLVHIKFNNLFGIPLNYINASTPISQFQLSPYHTVLSIDDTSFKIDVGYAAIIDTDPAYSFYTITDFTNDSRCFIYGMKTGGGECCYYQNINIIEEGYPNPSIYSIALKTEYKNIITAKIISSIFPRSQYLINNKSSDIVNNRIYWRNIDSGNYINFIEVTPGNYNPELLKTTLTDLFNKTIRYEYTVEYLNGIFPDIIENQTPINKQIYDSNGNYKYHIIDTKIDCNTNIVEFSAYKQFSTEDKTDVYQVVYIPDCCNIMTMAENLAINFGIGGTGIVPQVINPFDPLTEKLYIYFTEKTVERISTLFPYSYGNLYVFDQYIDGYGTTTNGFTAFTINIELHRKILVNFYRDKGVYPNNVSLQEIMSFNTNTLFQGVSFNYLVNTVYLPNHQLTAGSLLITDILINPMNPNGVYVYEITQIIDDNNFIVNRSNPGSNFKFIYDSLIINFNQLPATPTDSYYWLDQITTITPIAPINLAGNNNTLSIATYDSTPQNKKFAIIRQENHQLQPDDVITISNSVSINNVPSSTINQSHNIVKIIDDNKYLIILPPYVTQSGPVSPIPFNQIIIKYPDQIQMFFDRKDTLGNILAFRKVGEQLSITPYAHIIRNIDPYNIDYNFNSLGSEYSNLRCALNFNRDDYYYIVIPELSTYDNTDPVNNVFAKIRNHRDSYEDCSSCCDNYFVDTFVPTVKYFENPLSSLSRLNISIIRLDGRPVDFNCKNHSFTIELKSVYNQPEETDINVRINSELLVRRT